MKKDHGFTHAFTLVELIVVIAIIGLLAALLLPSVASVQAHAAMAQSISNLRTFGAAYAAFSSEHSGRVPPAACTLPNPSDFGPYANGKSWDYWLLPYLGYQAGDGYGELTDANCPKAEKLFYHPRDKNLCSMVGIRRTYSANLYATPVVSGSAKWTTATQFFAPSRLIVLSEYPFTRAKIGRSVNAFVYPGAQLSGVDGNPPLNPGGTFNYLFADGHVETMNLEQTYTPSDDYPAAGGSKPGVGTGAKNLWQNSAPGVAALASAGQPDHL